MNRQLTLLLAMLALLFALTAMPVLAGYVDLSFSGTSQVQADDDDSNDDDDGDDDDDDDVDEGGGGGATCPPSCGGGAGT